MLSVGSRDEGRKRSVLGLEGSGVAGRRQMEEHEIEEGEAYSGQDNHIDPDALSYIDEKLQHVLGHFQKEFEAGVSAETLGAKFGGYGSFLPVYQRSPPVTLSQPKSPAKVPGLNLLKSPHNLQPEVGCQNASVPANASITKANTAPIVQRSVKYGKRDTSISSCSTDGVTQHESTRKTLDIKDPKSLKMRIKVGPDDVLIRNKPEIYSDLGLDISPSPSPEDSPNGSRELSPESPYAFIESPSTILQVMTRFPVPGSYFLSPLSETLLRFLEKEDTPVTNIKKNPSQNAVIENFTASSETSLHTKNVRDFAYKENNSGEKGQKSVQAHRMTSEDVITTCLKNESGRRSPAAQKVVLSTHDMALSSGAWCVDAKDEMHFGGNSIKEYGKMFDVHNETNKIPAMEKVQALDFRKDNYVEFIDSVKVNGSYNSDKESVPLKGKKHSKPHTAEKAFEETNGNFDTTTKSKSKSQKHVHKNKSDSDKHRMRKDCSTGFEEHVKYRPARKVCSSENKMTQDKDQAFEDGKMIKGSQNETPFNELNKEKQNALFSESLKGTKKKLHVKGSHLERKSKVSKSQKDVDKGHNTESQSELLLSVQAQQAENGTRILGSSISTEKSNEKAEVNKVDNALTTGSVTDMTAPLIDSVSKNDAVPALVLIEDNWVCCDICQRWRLLPYGTNPDSLPKKWHCSMQVWLPGLNNCNVSQDETTKAFHELYQFPVPGNDTNVTTHLSATASSITSASTPNPARRPENVMHNAPLNGKKKYGSMDATDLRKDSSLTNLPNSSKNLPASSGNKDFNDVNYCSEMYSTIKPKQGWTNRSTNFSGEKCTPKQKEKHTAASSYKVGGDSSERSGKNSKPINKRGADVDGHRISKKLKKEGSYHVPKDLHSNFDTSGKMAIKGDNEMFAKAPKNILQNYNDHSSKDLKSKSGSSKKSRGERKEIFSVSESENSRKYDFHDKKGKLKEQSQTCGEISMSSEQITGSRLKLKEALIDGETRRQNNAKVAKPDGKESRTVIVVGNIEMKGCSTKISLSRNRKHLPDEIDNVGLRATTDEQLLRSLATTTSSSSKVSGSQKGKVNVPETRGSPVESVSSSPLRILSTEKNSARRNSLIKDNVMSIGYSGMVSPKRYSDGEFDGSSDQSGTRAKDRSSNDCLRASEIYRSAESGVLDSLKESHDYEDTETRSLTCVKDRDGRHSKSVKHDVISTDIVKANTVCNSGNVPLHPKKCHLERADKNPTCDEDERYESGQKNYGKSSLHSREKVKSLNFDNDKSKLKGTVTELKDLLSMRTSNKRRADTEFDNINASKKLNLENHSKQHNAHELRPVISGERKKPTSQQNPQHASSHERQNPSGLLVAEAVDRSVLDKDKLDKKVWSSQTAPESKNGGNLELCSVDVLNCEASKSAKPSRKLDEQNGTLANLSKQPTSGVPGSSSPVKKDGHSVNIFIKEARDLKHTANRLKSLGLEDESSGIFFESALKFLHASYLLEPCNIESAKQGEQVPSPQMLQMYYDTAKFCEFCAHEYERLKEMVAAALAYKCAEVAYLKIAYYKHPSANKDRVDLQIALDAPMPGESPSSSASDVDNLNNQGGVDKVASTKVVCSPQVAGNHAIAARNRPHVIRLLTYTNYLNCAFEATRKSQNAIAAASTDLGKSGIDVCSSRKVLDFNFHNVEGLLRLVRLSMNSVGQ